MSLGSQKQPRGALLLHNLPALQHLIKKQPQAYHAEFQVQFSQFRALFSQLENGETSSSDRIRELIGFLAQTAPLFPQECASFPSDLSSLLLNSHSSLSPETRKTLIQSLVLLKNKGLMNRVDLLKILFPLLGMTSSPNLRAYILKTILNDIKLANQKAKNHKLNRLVQGLLFGIVEKGVDTSSAATVSSAREAMMAVKLAAELWRKQIWTDPKTVQIIAEAVFHQNVKVQNAAIHFFLKIEEDEPVDSDEEEQKVPDIKKMYHQSTINKTRRSTKKKEKQTVKSANNKRKRQQAIKDANSSFPAIQLLLDPQTFAEKLYELLAKNDKKFPLEHRVLIMQLFGRVTGLHKVTVLGFYSYALKYLTHHQQSVTSILVAVAQSVHELTPPDVLTPVVRKLTNEFIHPGVAAEVIAAGLNAVREVCRRQPLCMEKDLLEDLVEYRKSKDKGILTAARSLLQLYRDVDPSLLRKRERGKLATMNAKDKVQPAFGHASTSVAGIAGLDLLQAHMAEHEGEEVDEEAQWQDWEADSGSESDASETGWIDVSSDGEQDIQIDDSDDEDQPRAKRRHISKAMEDEDDASSDISFQLKDDSDDDILQQNDADVATDDSGSKPGGGGELPEALQPRNIAAEQILTPADFARINQLQTEAAEQELAQGGGSASRRKIQALAAAKKAAQAGQFLSEAEILGVRKRAKETYDERMASIQAGREGREKFGSKKGKKQAEKTSSTTNDQKRRSKNFVLTLHSSKVKSKKNASLRGQQKKLRGQGGKQKKRK